MQFLPTRNQIIPQRSADFWSRKRVEDATSDENEQDPKLETGKFENQYLHLWQL